MRGMTSSKKKEKLPYRRINKRREIIQIYSNKYVLIHQPLFQLLQYFDNLLFQTTD